MSKPEPDSCHFCAAFEMIDGKPQCHNPVVKKAMRFKGVEHLDPDQIHGSCPEFITHIKDGRRVDRREPKFKQTELLYG